MGNDKKRQQLGMAIGTASARLRKMILFDLVRRLGLDVCFRCGKLIEAVENLSIEHKQPWLDVSPDLFWDLSNIAFSHLVCNCAGGRRPHKKHFSEIDRLADKRRRNAATKRKTYTSAKRRLKYEAKGY